MDAKMQNNFENVDLHKVEEWYEWVFRLNHERNPFHPTVGSKYWDAKNDDSKIIWLAGVTATTRPAYKPNNNPNLEEIVNGAEAKVVYNDGNGKPIERLPQSIIKRSISLNKGHRRDLYIPASTELATEAKYPKLKEHLAELAKKIIDREDPPAFVEFKSASGKNIQELKGEQLKAEFRRNGTIGQLTVPKDNVFMLPEGNGAAAFSEYAVILKGHALEPGKNKLRFGIKGKHPAEFSYEVEYEINV